ncbi:MAG: ATP-dependent helicase C-terminal domain-containing protein [Planctomycetota bacterium]
MSAVGIRLAERVASVLELRYRDLVLDVRQAAEPDPACAARELELALRRDPGRVLVIDGELERFVLRVRLLRHWCPELGLPAMDEADLVEALAALCEGRKSFEELRRAPLLEVLCGKLTYQQLETLDREAPERLLLPSGSRARLRYETGRPPVLSAKVQDLFGVVQTPVIARGRVRCLVELLSPAMRPVQVTQDLESFWKTTYAVVRKDLRARYPKHAWPEVPPGFG